MFVKVNDPVIAMAKGLVVWWVSWSDDTEHVGSQKEHMFCFEVFDEKTMHYLFICFCQTQDSDMMFTNGQGSPYLTKQGSYTILESWL